MKSLIYALRLTYLLELGVPFLPYQSTCVARGKGSRNMTLTEFHGGAKRPIKPVLAGSFDDPCAHCGTSLLGDCKWLGKMPSRETQNLHVNCVKASYLFFLPLELICFLPFIFDFDQTCFGFLCWCRPIESTLVISYCSRLLIIAQRVSRKWFSIMTPTAQGGSNGCFLHADAQWIIFYL